MLLFVSSSSSSWFVYWLVVVPTGYNLFASVKWIFICLKTLELINMSIFNKIGLCFFSVWFHNNIIKTFFIICMKVTLNNTHLEKMPVWKSQSKSKKLMRHFLNWYNLCYSTNIYLDFDWYSSETLQVIRYYVFVTLMMIK